MLETSGLTVMPVTLLYICQFDLDMGGDSGTCYHGDMPNRCQRVKPDSVSVCMCAERRIRPLECGLVKTTVQMNKEMPVTTVLRQVM